MRKKGTRILIKHLKGKYVVQKCHRHRCVGLLLGDRDNQKDYGIKPRPMRFSTKKEAMAAARLARSHKITGNRVHI